MNEASGIDGFVVGSLDVELKAVTGNLPQPWSYPQPSTNSPKSKPQALTEPQQLDRALQSSSDTQKCKRRWPQSRFHFG